MWNGPRRDRAFWGSETNITPYKYPQNMGELSLGGCRLSASQCHQLTAAGQRMLKEAGRKGPLKCLYNLLNLHHSSCRSRLWNISRFLTFSPWTFELLPLCKWHHNIKSRTKRQLHTFLPQDIKFWTTAKIVHSLWLQLYSVFFIFYLSVQPLIVHTCLSSLVSVSSSHWMRGWFITGQHRDTQNKQLHMDNLETH